MLETGTRRSSLKSVFSVETTRLSKQLLEINLINKYEFKTKTTQLQVRPLSYLEGVVLVVVGGRIESENF